jgi:hypothetical protein
MPEGFTGTMSVFSTEVWLPLGVYDEIASDLGGGSRRNLLDRTLDDLLVIGRLKPGVTAEMAAPALKGLATNLESAFPVRTEESNFHDRSAQSFRDEQQSCGSGTDSHDWSALNWNGRSGVVGGVF